WTAPRPGLYWVKTLSSDGQFGDQRYYHLGIDGAITPSALFSTTLSGLQHLSGSSALETHTGGMVLLGRGTSASGSGQGVDWLTYAPDLATPTTTTRIVPAQSGFTGDFDVVGARQNADGTLWMVGSLKNPGPIGAAAAHVDPASGNVLRGLQLGAL